MIVFQRNNMVLSYWIIQGQIRVCTLSLTCVNGYVEPPECDIDQLIEVNNLEPRNGKFLPYRTFIYLFMLLRSYNSDPKKFNPKSFPMPGDIFLLDKEIADNLDKPSMLDSILYCLYKPAFNAVRKPNEYIAMIKDRLGDIGKEKNFPAMLLRVWSEYPELSPPHMIVKRAKESFKLRLDSSNSEEHKDYYQPYKPENSNLAVRKLLSTDTKPEYMVIKPESLKTT